MSHHRVLLRSTGACSHLPFGLDLLALSLLPIRVRLLNSVYAKAMPNNSDSQPVVVGPQDWAYMVPSAILMDGLLHSFCLGFVLALGIKYWEEYATDSIRKRAFVLTIVFLSTVQTVLEDYKIWTVAVSHHLWPSSPFFWTDFFVNGAISSMCEAFYIRRCWKMTGKSPWVLYPMALLWISIVGAQFYITITLGLEFHDFRANDHRVDEQVEGLLRGTINVFSYWVVGCTILDIAVAVILITCLTRSKTGLDASDSVINRVIFLALETALLPSISMIVAVIVLHGAPRPGQHDDLVLFFVFMTAKFYAIGLLRTLNARARLRQRIDSTDLGRTTLSTWAWNQEQQPATTADKPAMETTTRGTVSESSALTFNHCEGIAPNEIPEAAGPPRVHFGSPQMAQCERGYARLRVSSINKTKQETDEHP